MNISDKTIPRIKDGTERRLTMKTTTTYNKTQDAADKSHKCFRVMGIIFENGASDEKIEAAINEVYTMEELAPGLMTAKAICNYMEILDDYVLQRMLNLPIGGSFKYMGTLITRWSDLLYNGKAIKIE